MLFGKQSESRAAVCKELAGRAGDEHEPAGEAQVQSGEQAAAAEHKTSKGHGRNGADAYPGASVVVCPHPYVQTGQLCPECAAGKLYLAEPRVVVKMAAQLPIGATIYQLESWRCRLCEAILTTPLPEGVDARKYDASCASMIALLRYGSGMPFHRLDVLQSSLGVPLPDATQWDIVSKAAHCPRQVFDELIRQAAQGEVLHNDDTPARILALMGERRVKAEAAGNAMPATRAISTSGIVALLGTHKAMLFFTGPEHAGSNLARVLAHRAEALAAPVQMCDALTANMKGDFETILSHCIAHGRRKFVEVAENFPAPCRHVIDSLAQLYRNDAHCKERNMSATQRLDYHRGNSAGLMLRLHIWMYKQLAHKQVEPNSGLGQALRYMLKHWPALTLFLRVPGAPLDNNICELALKKAICHRKNSLFYRSERGAEVGDIYMSLIFTCQSCGANPFSYLQALQKHAAAVALAPQRWLPWNYLAALPGGA
jgi:transposase